MPRRLSQLALATLALWCPRLGWAQSLLVGTVTADGRPLPRAEVLVDPPGLRTSTSDRGTFSLTVPGLGAVRVVVRAVGYYPATRRIMLAGPDTVTLTFQLERAAQQLESVTVEAPKTTVRGKMQAFEERRGAGFGSFLTREALARQENSMLEDVLRRISGLRLVRRPDDCGGGSAVATGRGGVVKWQAWMSCYGGRPFPLECYLAVYLDGTRIWAPGSKEPPDINQFYVNGLEGIEVYRGPSEAPIQYQGTGSACGVLLLWTRTGDG